jgi:hypothetical protein
MILHRALANASTEEDVKDAYIKALGLKGVSKNLVDIQTKEMWFEAKWVATPPIAMFGQLLVDVRAAKKRGEAIPGFLAVIDRDKAAIMAGMALSPEAKAVLDEGRTLWQRYHATAFPRKIRDELKLNRPDVGWYQVRKALEANGDSELTNLPRSRRPMWRSATSCARKCSRWVSCWDEF